MFHIPVFIINKDSATDRFQACYQQIHPFFQNIHRFQAITPEFAKANALGFVTYEVFNNIENTMTNENIHPTWSSVACGLSHSSIWQHILHNTDIPYALVVEDDIEIVSSSKFSFKFHEMVSLMEMNRKKKMLKNDETASMIIQFDGLKLSQTHSFMTSKETAKLNQLHKPLNDYVSLVKHKTIFTHAYLINREACSRLLDWIFPFKHQLDIELSLLSQKNMDIMDYFHFNCVDAGTRQNPSFPSQVQYRYYKKDEWRLVFQNSRLPENCLDLIYAFLPIRKGGYFKASSSQQTISASFLYYPGSLF